jgi:hypothetical protein
MKKLALLFCSIIALIQTSARAQDYFLNGNAVATGNSCYQLTDIWNNQNGTVWYADLINLVEDFDITFTMNLGNQDANGADGICFVLQNIGNTAIGVSGGGMGYQSFTTSLGIEFDTWQNNESGDPSYDHIAIEKNGDVNHNTGNNLSGPVQMSTFNTNTEDGQNHVVQIKWDASENLIQVYFDCIFRTQATIDIANEIFNGQSYVYWGFSAATGGATNIHSVCLEPNIFASASQLQACPGTTIQLNAGPSATGNYTWTPAAGLSNPNIANPSANPSVTTTYTVDFTNLCGLPQTSSITVNIDDLEITTPPVAILQCSDTLVTVNTSSNFTGLSYQWFTDNGQILGSDTLSTLNTSTAGTYYIAADYDNQCFDTATVVINADYSDFSLFVNYDSLITCADNSLTLAASTNSAGTIYIWSTNGGNITSAPNQPNVNVNAGGSYTVNAFFSEECQDAFTLTVDVNQTIPTTTPSDITEINCFSPSINLSVAVDLDNNSYDWSGPNGQNINVPANQNNVNITQAGNYQVEVTNNLNGCSSIETFNVSIDTISPIISWFDADTISCLNPVVILDNYTVNLTSWDAFWSTNFGIIQSEMADELYPSVLALGEYNLTVTNPDNGCESYGTTIVPANNNIDFDPAMLTFPNIISMNGDTLNAQWRPFLKDQPEEDTRQYFKTYQLNVFNRWGTPIFESSSSTPYWKPSELSLGTYFYTFVYETTCGTGKKDEISGSVMIAK